MRHTANIAVAPLAARAFAVSRTGTVCVMVVLGAVVSGCAAVPQTPIRLAQWSWGRNVDLSRKKAPDFDSPEENADDQPSDDTESAPKEPRRLFGFGQPAQPKPERDSEGSSWFSRSPASKSNKDDATDEGEERQRQQQYARAEELFQEGRFDDVEPILKPLTKKKKNFWSGLRLWSAEPDYRQDHDRVREDSLFLLAESYFKQERFNHAKEYYEALLKDYPSTRHLNVSAKRLFVIGKTWLGMPEFVTSDDVTPVNVEDPRSTPKPKLEKPPHSAVLVPNLTDKTRPAFDTPGHALEALKAIWLYDPRGPLADDAIMLTASHHLRVGNYQESDRYFSMLREEYPNSPHLQTSFVLGSHVKLMSYQGAGYDVKQLEDARQLKESTLRLFPNIPEKDRLKEELAKIEEAEAQRTWELVRFYRRKNKPKAVVIHAEEILQKYPNSQYAPQARELLDELRPGSAEKSADRFTSLRNRLRRNSTDDAVEVESDDDDSAGRASIPNTE